MKSTVREPQSDTKCKTIRKQEAGVISIPKDVNNYLVYKGLTTK